MGKLIGWLGLWIGCMGLLMGCMVQDDGPHVITATSAPTTPEDLPPLSVALQYRQQTASPQATQEVTPNATEEPTPTLEPTPIVCDLPADATTRPQYKVEALMNWSDKTIQADQTIQYTNTTGAELEQLVLQVEPNRDPGFFSLQGVLGPRGTPLDGVSLRSNQLTVPLPRRLGINCSITVDLSYTVRIPPVIGGYYGRFGYFGYTQRQVNLGHWMPVMAPHYTDEWNVPRPHFVGEQIITESSDFEVVLTIPDLPPTAKVTGAGLVRIIGDREWRFVIENARELSISIGTGMQRASRIGDDGTVIEVYYFPESTRESGLDAHTQVLDATSEALMLFEELFGAPYPFERLVVVEGDFPDGMEFSGLVFVGEAWFRIWQGEPNSWLTAITVHEVAHQWWYNLVGNNPATYPYLDEAFATYSEYLYFQRYYGELNDWWWDFRVRGYDTQVGGVDVSVYDFTDARPYINMAYLRGADMLHTIRLEMGDEAFFSWLQAYVLDQSYQIATPQDLWTYLPTEVYQAVQPIREAYLNRADVLPTSTLD